jgi:hypothetical protein
MGRMGCDRPSQCSKAIDGQAATVRLLFPPLYPIRMAHRSFDQSSQMPFLFIGKLRWHQKRKIFEKPQILERPVTILFSGQKPLTKSAFCSAIDNYFNFVTFF